MAKKKTARNDWGLLRLRASMLYHLHIDHAPVRTKKFWSMFSRSKDVDDAWLVTEAFRLSFKRGD